MELYFHKHCYPSFLFFLISFSILSCTLCQDNTNTSCLEEFKVEPENAELVDFSEASLDVLSLIVSVSEGVDVGSILYHISWIDDSKPSTDNDVDENTVLDYNEFITVGNSLSVQVVNSTLGIMDYDTPNRTEYLKLGLYFEFVSVSDMNCKIEIRHDFKDANTKVPHFSLNDYSLSIAENYPISYPIYTVLQPEAFDFDSDPPNNEFQIIMNEDCPLSSTEITYVCNEGISVPILFWLVRPVDYDTMKPPYQYICTATLQDYGDPPLSSNSTFIVTVLPIPDEDPLFSSSFYKGYLVDTSAGSVVRVVPKLVATDADISSSPQMITYSMTSTNNYGDKYFSINGSTGEVSLIQDVDNDLLALKYVHFMLKACDEDDQCGKSLLTITLPVQSSHNDSLEFDKDTYTTLITTQTSKNEVILQVHALSTNNQENVEYYFVDDGSPGLDYFIIKGETGEIMTSQDAVPNGQYELTTGATDGNSTDQTMVIIDSNIIFRVEESIASVSVHEYTYSFYNIYQVKAEGAIKYCILSVQPEYFEDNFDINSENGFISVTGLLDADTKHGNLVAIKAGAYTDDVKCTPSKDFSHILMNEVLLNVEISDYNDNDPYFVDPTGEKVTEVLFAFPTDYTLQRAIGPVGKVLVRDDDVTVNKLNYKLIPYQGYNSDDFEVDYFSGEIYLTGKIISTRFYIKVSDTFDTEVLTVNIDILEPSYISSIYFPNLNESELDNKIAEVSDQAGVPVYLLYSNLIDDVYGDGFWMIEAQVYSTDDMELIDWEDLEDKMDDIDNIEVKPFSEEKYFYDDDDNGYRTATIVLGCICGLYLLAAMAYLIYTLCNKGTQKQSRD